MEGKNMDQIIKNWVDEHPADFAMSDQARKEFFQRAEGLILEMKLKQRDPSDFSREEQKALFLKIKKYWEKELAQGSAHGLDESQETPDIVWPINYRLLLEKITDPDLRKSAIEIIEQGEKQRRELRAREEEQKRLEIKEANQKKEREDDEWRSNPEKMRQLEEKKDRLMLRAIELINDKKWTELSEFLEKISLTKLYLTDFYIQIFNKLKKFSPDDYTYDDEWVMENSQADVRVIFRGLIENISKEKSNLAFFEQLQTAEEKPQFFIEAFNRGEVESLPSYYYRLCQAALATRCPEAGFFVSRVLSGWDEDATAYIKQNNIYQESTEEESDEQKAYINREARDRQIYILEEEKNVFFSLEALSEIADEELGASYKEDLLLQLKEFKDDRIVDNLIEFIKNSNNPSLFIRRIADTINEIAPERAIGPLLRLLRGDDEFVKRDASAILHRLEFGRIGISEEGVQYLERMYDLGELNNPNYHVSRLTADGEIGIFDEELKLIKFFALGDLSTPETRVQAKVLDFTYETLFVGKEGESAEEREKRLQYLEEFKKHYYEIAQDKIFSETGVRLNNLSFKEQGWFIVYFNEADEAGKERLRKFVANHGEEGIKTFLSLEGGEKNGEVILDLGQKLDKETASRVFGKFNELASFIKSSGEELSQEFFNNDKTIEPHAEILKRAGQILVDFQKNLPEDIASMNEKERKELFLGIREKLDKIKKDVVFFGSMFKVAYKNQSSVDFSEVRGLDFSINKSLTPQQEQDIINLTERRYRQYNPEQLRGLIADVKKSFLARGTSKWYLLYHQGKLIGTSRFDQRSDEKKYMASVMVDPEYDNSAIGSALLKNSMDAEAKDFVLEALVTTFNPIKEYYVRRGGFIITGIKIHEGTGNTCFIIERDDEKNRLFQGKSDRQVKIEGGENKQFAEPPTPEDISAIEEKINAGFVITNILPTSGEKDKRQYIFEQRSVGRIIPNEVKEGSLHGINI